MMPNQLLFVVAVTTSITLLGCGSSDRPALHPVSGTITYAGEPLGDASVTFMPESGLVAVGKTDSSGHFTLKTRGMDGAVAGPFTVVVTATEKSGDLAAGEWENLTDQERRKRMKSLIPERYGQPTASGLEAIVAPKQPNEFNFDLVK